MSKLSEVAKLQNCQMVVLPQLFCLLSLLALVLLQMGTRTKLRLHDFASASGGQNVATKKSPNVKRTDEKSPTVEKS